ncbi:alpha-L-rhamnosidase-related protein [Arcticibacter eurypsychrophilus]|uniref:alpha-L-rhamnosidase-related protein n=1 Tax=Arcticibacter eurypsychrophilus TaxID=1434752 RepID=UPI00084D46F9|nr:alpha-L-rhamnosidase C-terminal domain-containing protein [Arcticibacter eurypsychrophilus]
MKKEQYIGKAFILLSFILMLSTALSAQSKATWIWYPGDFEIWLSNNMQNRRTERDTFFSPFWRQDSHYVLIDFHKVFTLSQPEEVEIATEGKYNVKLDGKMLSGFPKKINIPAGKHKLNLKVHAQDRVPAIYIKGKTLVSDSSWLVTFEDKEWIDETGKASDQSGTTWLNAGSWNFNDVQSPPSQFKLSTKPQYAVSKKQDQSGLLLDFGKETFGFIKLHGLKGTGKAHLYYGESKEEALSIDAGETLDKLHINNKVAKDSVINLSKAFRFVNIKLDLGVSMDSASMLYEYLPVADRGSFKSSDEELNKIWDISKYTMELTTREFFIDGIKRDRWIWSGDAYQSYLMNYYLSFDSPTVTRTILALRGKEPVSSHINTIMDYTFYWFLSVQDYYQYTGDKTFVNQLYPRMKTMMDYCLSRRNKDGMMEGLAGDWVFIDWADGLSKKGEVSFEQLLFCRSLETMAVCADLSNDPKGAAEYRKTAEELKAKIFAMYWNADKKALVHSRVNGVQSENVTRYANMFGIFFDYFNKEQKDQVKQSVLLNDKVQQIVTPYMRFYELEALCAMGEQDYVLKEIKDYWGGMLKLGATSFWEEYNPSKKDDEHYAMYGRPFGKSLCHAWGASPLYLMGKYYLGVKPLTPGYQTYSIEPVLGGLKWMEGSVPTPHGDIKVYCSHTEVRVSAETGTGLLKLKSRMKPVCKNATVLSKGDGLYEIALTKGQEYTITYKL